MKVSMWSLELPNHVSSIVREVVLTDLNFDWFENVSKRFFCQVHQDGLLLVWINHSDQLE